MQPPPLSPQNISIVRNQAEIYVSFIGCITNTFVCETLKFRPPKRPIPKRHSAYIQLVSTL